MKKKIKWEKPCKGWCYMKTGKVSTAPEGSRCPHNRFLLRRDYLRRPDENCVSLEELLDVLSALRKKVVE